MLIMMMGVPGSGKSTIALEYAALYRAKGYNVKIISSDGVRAELYGDESIQGDNKQIFSIVESRIFEQLRADGIAIYDATNLSSKRRKDFVQRVKAMFPEAKAHCIDVDPSLGTCLERNEQRERHVPRSVICRMYVQKEPPFITEGWDDIKTVLNS